MKTPPTITVRKSSFSIDDPWAPPAESERVHLTNSSDGSRPRLATDCSLYRDDQNLYVSFSGEDDGIVATHLEHDAPLYEEDAFEVFLSPDTLTTYYEIEVSPLGTTFDARVISPDGDRRTMRVEREWDCHGLWTAVRRIDGRTEAIVAIPFMALDRGVPRAGETWRANLYRIDRSARQGDEYSAWSPTGRTPADFHVPSAFGTFFFE